ncbi:MAG: matrixin family metalloprotease [Candidatus Taylorbacteria bacterium]|nr:matrixin family metalloprotease [Candidatus Taylorbacteria bacterium]
MKKFLIFLIVIFAGIGVFYYRQTSICRRPLTYDIGSFDNSFGVSKEKFLKTIKEAEAVWEKGAAKDLFEHKAGGKLKISLVFDERQATTFEAGESQEQIEGSRASYDILISQYKVTELSYKSNLAEYNSQVSRFEQQLQYYNAKVSELNSKGGAPAKEYEELKQERMYLEDLKYQLDKDRLSLNTMSSKLNALGDQVNELAQKLNIEVDIHNQRFGEAREFDQGDYTNNKINIYQFNGTSDLRLVIAHEFGHALDLGHVENPKSIMYYLMDKQDLNSPSLTREDKEALLNRCTFHIPKLQEIFSLSQESNSVLQN